jgi:hypothetical protein
LHGHADPALQKFLAQVLDKYPAFMELGSLGPDLPYYGSLLKGLWNAFLNRSDKPVGVDAWSYQLHSKEPNVFPLKMIEITWKETDIDTEDWDETDRMKFAFLCGFLTHVAADQVVHPVVNSIAGPYCKKLGARDEHRRCEVHQDLYALARSLDGRLPIGTFKEQAFGSWCSVQPDALWTEKTIWFRYLIEKAFVEAHAVTPGEKAIGRWIKGTVTTLKHCIHLSLFGCGLFGPYGTAYRALFDGTGALQPEAAAYRKYIGLEGLNTGRTYDAYWDEAVDLAKMYIQAAHRVYCANDIDDTLRKKFRRVVRSADLGSPLERDILLVARQALSEWVAETGDS